MIHISRGLKPLAGLTAAVLLSATMTATSQASTTSRATVGTGTAAVAAADRAPVLESDYGKARSRVKGTFGKNGVVTGTFTPRKFVNRNGNLMVVGVLEATLTKASGVEVGVVEERVKLPVRLAEGQPVGARQVGCDILNLVLGPLDLNLLGLEVHLNRVVLDIIATPGPGNLLGNLLCAVAGLLDGVGGTGILTQISQILNAILAILNL